MSQNRREFLSLFAIGLGSLAVLKNSIGKAFAADACPTSAPAGKKVVEGNDAFIKSSKYVVDATKATDAKYKKGDSCSGCKFYQVAKADGGYAPCTMAGNKFVSSCGWCNKFAKKA